MREDWIEAELGEICNINMGQSPPSTTYNDRGDGLPFFQGKAEFTLLHPKVKKWCNKPKKIAEVEDILLSVRAPVGATNIANVKCAIGRGLAAISYKPCMLFVLYFLKLIEKKLDEQGTGTTFRAISGAILKSQKIPLPPLPEQRAIVAKIEELFSELDNGIANLKAAKDKLEIYRQAVLKKAFEGELTNTKNIEWITLGEVCDNVEYGTSSKSDKEGQVPVLRMGNIQNGKFDWQDLVFTSDKEEIKKYKLHKDDVLFNRTNSPEWVGKTAIYKGERPAIFAGYLIRVNYKKDLIDGDYLNYYLNSHTAKKWGNKVKSFGVNQANINGTKLKKYPFPQTSLQDQKEIVIEIETRLSVCDNIQKSIDENLQKAKALRQSILKKAFEGRLLNEEELKACRLEPDWEPAEELLKRIKDEKKAKA